MNMSFERRRDERIEMSKSVKLYQPKARRYRSARTSNVSVSGALIELPEAVHITVGERLDIVVDYTESQPVMQQSDLTPAIVVRVESDGAAARKVAVRFGYKQCLPNTWNTAA